MTDAAEVADRRAFGKQAAHQHAYRDRRHQQAILALITDDVIAEHASDSIGRRPDLYSEALQQVLKFFRAHPSNGRHVACRLRGDGRWGVAMTRPGSPPVQMPGLHFATLEEARHAAFLCRVDQLRADLKGG